ncbi:MAG TPA: mechanosensitive ion channel protein MscS [Paenibacillaceae bacterium]|nr:mechanosensitive ion channel protein MscS [Paenibacillaceae bacterium]
MEYISNEDRWISYGVTILKILLVLILAKIIVKISDAAVDRIFIKREGDRFQKLRLDARRSETMRALVKNISKYVIYFIVFFNIFTFLGYDPKPILASAGVIGLAVGFGAQNLVRDVITGFFIIFEDQFAVGDTVMINNVTGTVQEIGLRITKIKAWTGEIHIIPNGSITQVTNLSVENSVAIVDVSISYNEDIDKVVKLLQEKGSQWKESIEEIVETPKVLGVERFGQSDIVIRITAECKPTENAKVTRQLRSEIVQLFEEKGIKIPYSTMVMMNPIEQAQKLKQQS